MTKSKGTKKSFTKEVTSKISSENSLRVCQVERKMEEGMPFQVKRAVQKHRVVKDHGLETEFSMTGPD